VIINIIEIKDIKLIKFFRKIIVIKELQICLRLEPVYKTLENIHGFEKKNSILPTLNMLFSLNTHRNA